MVKHFHTSCNPSTRGTQNDPQCGVSAVSDEPGRPIRRWIITWRAAWSLGSCVSSSGARAESVPERRPHSVVGRGCYHVTGLSTETPPHEWWKNHWPVKRIKVMQKYNIYGWNTREHHEWMKHCWLWSRKANRQCDSVVAVLARRTFYQW